MPKGKRGPRPAERKTNGKSHDSNVVNITKTHEEPEVLTCATHDISFNAGELCPICASEAEDGAIDVQEEQQQEASVFGTPAAQMEYVCPNCPFRTDYDGEAEEHATGTGHAACAFVEKKPKQTDLFSEPETVTRSLRAKISPVKIAEINGEVARLCLLMTEQRETAELAKEKAKTYEAEMLRASTKLRDPYELASVQCRWDLSLEENAKKLIRLDTNEVVETRALSEEDRARELARAQHMNQAPAETVLEAAAG